MSRFAIDPRWLVYLPPTMAPTATSPRAGRCSSTRRRRSPSSARRASRRSSARRSTWARGRSRSSAATRTSARERFGVDGAGGASTRAPAGRSSTTREPSALERVRDAVGARRAVGGAGHRLARARLRAAAVVGEGDGADPAPVRRRRRGGPVGARAPPSARWRPPRRAGSTSATLLDRTRDRGRARRPLHRRLPPLRLAGRRRSTTCGWRRSTCSPPSPASSPTATTPGTCEHCDALVAADPDWIRRTDRRVVDVTDPAAEAEATAWWEAMTAARRRGHGRQADDLHRPRAPRPGPAGRQVSAAASTCASSTAPSTTRPAQLDRLRSRGLGRKRSLALARVRARASRRWSASCAASRCTACTSASSACWRWSPSRSTRACKSAQKRHRVGTDRCRSVAGTASKMGACPPTTCA